MACGRFEELLFAALDRELTTKESTLVERHTSECASCRGLAQAVAGDPASDADPGAGSPPADLVASVLRSTSGDTCAVARARLATRMDARALPRDGALEVHLQGCDGCRSLAAVLGALAQDLPALQSLDPGPEFTAGVVAATARRRRWHQSLPGPRGSWLSAGQRAWSRLADRPRLAWEGAYIGTLAMVLLASVPGSPLPTIPERTLSLVRAEGARLQDTVGQRAQTLVDQGRASWSATATDVRDRWLEVSGSGTSRAVELAGSAGSLARVTATLRASGEAAWAWATAAYRQAIAPWLNRARALWGDASSLVWTDREDPNDRPSDPRADTEADNERPRREPDDDRHDNAL